MPTYEYRGLTSSGRNVRGVREADGLEGLRAALRREGIVPTELKEARTAADGRTARTGMAGREVRFGSFRDRAKPADISLATRQLATLIRAGIPLVESLTAIVEQTQKEQLKRALATIRDQVNEGTALADGLRAHPKLFADYYVNMVHAGEQSGTLDAVLDRLADFTEAQGRMRSKVTAALAYPMIMAVLGAIIVGILMVVVVPQVTTIFRDFGKDLPWYTELLVSVSHFVGNWWWAAGLAITGVVLLFRQWKRSASGRKVWDRFVLRVPIAGDIAMKVAIARFARTLSTLLHSGVPILRAMEITRNVMGNAELEGIVEDARLSVQEGESIAEPLKRSGRFDPIVTHMIAVGERSGQLEQMLLSVAGSYELQVETRLSTLTSLLEPIMIVVMGGAAAGIAASIMLPLLQLSDFMG
ncbi:MAG: type II secretion system inner membrane protein GspF [Deltaproteobacteria bacterium]|nr:type II secretion system inner membrane protein GspF [Deltaproteobacteria bacterium]